MPYQEITTFEMDPTDFDLEEKQEVEALRSTSGEVLEMQKVGLPTLRIQGSYKSASSVNLTRTDSSTG
jgi:hypothetical protein